MPPGSMHFILLPMHVLQPYATCRHTSHTAMPQPHPRSVLPPAAAGDQKLVSPITTHVLDSALGCPAKGLLLALYKQSPGGQDVWEQLAGGVTNDDGRVPNLLPASDYIAPGRCEACSWPAWRGLKLAAWEHQGIMLWCGVAPLQMCHGSHCKLFMPAPLAGEPASGTACLPGLPKPCKLRTYPH